MKKTFEYDLGYLQACLEVMESYLFSDEVFWPVSGTPPEGAPDYPRLTLGGLLLAERRLIAYPQGETQATQVQKIISQIELIRTKWRVLWEKKAGRSYSVRLRMWGDFLDEYRSSPLDNADRYAYEVRMRVMLDILRSESGGQPTAEIEMLNVLDRYLKGVLRMGSFIWETEVQTGFPEGVYWYLYGKLPPR
jgi:hypothetical protein